MIGIVTIAGSVALAAVAFGDAGTSAPVTAGEVGQLSPPAVDQLVEITGISKDALERSLGRDPYLRVLATEAIAAHDSRTRSGRVLVVVGFVTLGLGGASLGIGLLGAWATELCRAGDNAPSCGQPGRFLPFIIAAPLLAAAGGVVAHQGFARKNGSSPEEDAFIRGVLQPATAQAPGPATSAPVLPVGLVAVSF